MAGVKVCDRKRHYRTRRQAKDAVIVLRRWANYEGTGVLREYLCARCGDYHIGHTNPTDQPKAR